MTTTIKGLCVTLKAPMREADAEKILNAIKQLRGVASVEVSTETMDDYFNREMVRCEMQAKLFEVLNKK